MQSFASLWLLFFWEFLTCSGGYVRIYLVKERKGNGPDCDPGYVDHVLDVNFTNEDSWTDKTDSNVSNRLFPIP